MKDLEKIAKELYVCCLNAKGAYSALKIGEVDLHLPGYDHCVSRLKRAIELYEEYRDETT